MGNYSSREKPLLTIRAYHYATLELKDYIERAKHCLQCREDRAWIKLYSYNEGKICDVFSEWCPSITPIRKHVKLVGLSWSCTLSLTGNQHTVMRRIRQHHKTI